MADNDFDDFVIVEDPNQEEKPVEQLTFAQMLKRAMQRLATEDKNVEAELDKQAEKFRISHTELVCKM